MVVRRFVWAVAAMSLCCPGDAGADDLQKAEAGALDGRAVSGASDAQGSPGALDARTMAGGVEAQADATVRAFYARALGYPGAGLPDGEDRSALPGSVTPALLALLDEAVDVETRCIAVTPDGDKPPLYEGSLWMDNYEGATEVTLERVVDPGFDGVTFEAQLMYVDARFEKASRERALAWTDRVRLVVRAAGVGESQAFRIDDIVYARGGTLRQRLREHVDVNRACIDAAR